MSTFRETPDLHKRIDYQIVENGWFQLYYSNRSISEDILWLEKNKYEIAEFTCNGLDNLLKQFKEYFYFPAHFHNNFNSLNDCLRDIEIKKNGLVIILKQLDSLKNETINNLLNIFINHARLNFIIGKRLLIIGQVNNKDFRAGNIGAIQIQWNLNEFYNSSRENNFNQD